MDKDEEIEYLRSYLEKGLEVICSALNIDQEQYDRDQAEGECYLDCFKDAARLIERSGAYYCKDEWEIKFSNPLIKDAERYRYLRDEESWGEDGEKDSFAELAESSMTVFDGIVDRRMTANT